MSAKGKRTQVTIEFDSTSQAHAFVKAATEGAALKFFTVVPEGEEGPAGKSYGGASGDDFVEHKAEFQSMRMM